MTKDQYAVIIKIVIKLLEGLADGWRTGWVKTASILKSQGNPVMRLVYRVLMRNLSSGSLPRTTLTLVIIVSACLAISLTAYNWGLLTTP